MTFFALHRHILHVNNSSIDENISYSVYQSQKMMEEQINGCKEVWRIYC